RLPRDHPTATPFPYTTLFRSARRGLRRADGGDGQAPDRDRRPERLGPRLAARAGDGRAALPARRRARHPPLRRRAPSRGAVQAAAGEARPAAAGRSEEHTSELESRENIVCRLLLE